MKNCINIVIIFLQMSTDPESVGSEIPSRNSPFIAEFNGEDCESDYFLYVEQISFVFHQLTYKGGVLLVFIVIYL